MKFGNTKFEVVINVATRDALFHAVHDKLIDQSGFALGTLNLDHLTKMADTPEFADVYNVQDLIVADGRPIVWMSQLAGAPVELMPGSDLVVPLCQIAAKTGRSVALIGSTDEALKAAAVGLQDRVPDLKIALTLSPPFGFDPTNDDANAVYEALNSSGAGLCITALGAPKQERFAAQVRERCPSVGICSFGAGLDFIAGTQTRAPKIVRKLALEWLWRVLQSPRRMVPRYAKCFAILPGHLWRSWQQR